jgi:hypothetical protein
MYAKLRKLAEKKIREYPYLWGLILAVSLIDFASKIMLIKLLCSTSHTKATVPVHQKKLIKQEYS